MKILCAAEIFWYGDHAFTLSYGYRNARIHKLHSLPPPDLSPSLRFQFVGRKVIRNTLKSHLVESPADKRILCRLGRLAAQDGNIEDAVGFLQQAAKVRVGCLLPLDSGVYAINTVAGPVLTLALLPGK